MLSNICPCGHSDRIVSALWWIAQLAFLVYNSAFYSGKAFSGMFVNEELVYTLEMCFTNVTLSCFCSLLLPSTRVLKHLWVPARCTVVLGTFWGVSYPRALGAQAKAMKKKENKKRKLNNFALCDLSWVELGRNYKRWKQWCRKDKDWSCVWRMSAEHEMPHRDTNMIEGKHDLTAPPTRASLHGLSVLSHSHQRGNQNPCEFCFHAHNADYPFSNKRRLIYRPSLPAWRTLAIQSSLICRSFGKL